MKLVHLSALIAGCVFAASAFADSQNPSIPQNVSASPLSDTSIRVSWNGSSDDTAVVGYNIYRDTNYYTTVRESTNYIDNAVSPGSTHRYRVTAFDDARNFSPSSNTAEATASSGGSVTGAVNPSDNSGPVSAPSGLQVSVMNGNQLQLQWSQASNAAGYNIFRDGLYHSTVKSSSTFRDSVDYNRDYEYRVSAFNSLDQHSSKSASVVGNSAGTSTTPSVQPRSGGGSVGNSGGVPDGYSLVFSEEFRGSSLDGAKWNSQYRWGPNLVINGERQYYVDAMNQPDFGHNPFEFDGEHMTINAIRTPDHLRDRANQQPYLSGTLTTFDKFTMRYGYVEMRAKMPRGRGMWPAFWLLHAKEDRRRPEIDVVEMLGHDTGLAYHTYHFFEGNQRLVSSPTFQAPGPDYSNDFHTYAIRWEPGTLVWLIDGVERNRYDSGNVSDEDMYLLLNLAVGGNWPGDPDGSTPFPARYTIDYIRAYTRP